MQLAEVQRYLCGFYDSPNAYAVDDFLITDSALASALAPSSSSANDERVLVAESDDGLALSLYLSAETLEQLDLEDPFVDLHEGNLAAFLLALEGVSHFNYLCWNASYDRSVTLLELELQAEVDKYVTARDLLQRQGQSATPDELHRRLFERIYFHEELDSQQLDRYRCANRYAAKYCHSLSENYSMLASRAYKNELRRFYRLSQNEKIRHIETYG